MMPVIGFIFVQAIAGTIGKITDLIDRVSKMVEWFNRLRGSAEALIKNLDRLKEPFLQILGYIYATTPAFRLMAGAIALVVRNLEKMIEIAGKAASAVNEVLERAPIGGFNGDRGVSGFLRNFSPAGQLENITGLNVSPFQSGGFTGRGPANETAGIVHRGEYVIPKDQVDQSTGLPKVTNNRSVTINTVVLGSADAAREFFDKLDSDMLLTSNGVSPMRGA
jgi:hypothetical protein